jgi:hypothetical protein
MADVASPSLAASGSAGDDDLKLKRTPVADPWRLELSLWTKQIESHTIDTFRVACLGMDPIA